MLLDKQEEKYLCGGDTYLSHCQVDFQLSVVKEM